MHDLLEHRSARDLGRHDEEIDMVALDRFAQLVQRAKERHRALLLRLLLRRDGIHAPDDRVGGTFAERSSRTSISVAVAEPITAVRTPG